MRHNSLFIDIDNSSPKFRGCRLGSTELFTTATTVAAFIAAFLVVILDPPLIFLDLGAQLPETIVQTYIDGLEGALRYAVLIKIIVAGVAVVIPILTKWIINSQEQRHLF